LLVLTGELALEECEQPSTAFIGGFANFAGSSFGGLNQIRL
jgi:hypothetical protein